MDKNNYCAQAGSLPLCLASLFQHKLPDFVVLRLTGFVFLLLLSSLLQKHKTCRPQSNKIKQFALEKGREAEGRGAGLVILFVDILIAYVLRHPCKHRQYRHAALLRAAAHSLTLAIFQFNLI